MLKQHKIFKSNYFLTKFISSIFGVDRWIELSNKVSKNAVF